MPLSDNEVTGLDGPDRRAFADLKRRVHGGKGLGGNAADRLNFQQHGIEKVMIVEDVDPATYVGTRLTPTIATVQVLYAHPDAELDNDDSLTHESTYEVALLSYYTSGVTASAESPVFGWAVDGELFLGGVSNSRIYGKIDTAVPAGGIVADAIDAYYRADDGTLQPLLDDLDVQIRYGAQNMNSFSNITIYSDPADAGNPIKVFVWGFPFSYNFGTVEVPDVQTVMEIWNPPTELALYEGFVKSPANGVGQVPLHHNGNNKTVVEAGPCGGVV